MVISNIKGVTMQVYIYAYTPACTCMRVYMLHMIIHLTAGWNTYVHTQYALFQLSMNL